MQSDGWADFQKTLGRDVFRVEKNNFSALVIKYPIRFFGRFYGNYLYVPRVDIKDFDDLDFLISEAKDLAKTEKSMLLRIEPLSTISLSKFGFYKISSVQPDVSLIMDLSKSKEEILRKMDHDTRYSVRTAEKRGVKIAFTKTIGRQIAFEEFWKMFVETSRRQGIGHYGKNYYEELSKLDGGDGGDLSSEIVLAELNGVYIAGAIIIYSGDTATYLYAASLSGYGRYNAPSYVIWRAMCEAKDRGLKYFDFWGISDQDDERHKRWAKLSAFKKSFGGREVHYPGTYDLPLNKSVYYIYNTARKLARSI